VVGREDDAPAGLRGGVPRAFDLAEWERRSVDGERAGGDLGGERGELGDDRGGGDGALATAHDAQVRSAQGGGREGDVRSGDGADLDPVERPTAVVAVGDQGADGVLGGRAPEVVDDDVDVGGGFAEHVVGVLAGQRDGDVGTEVAHRGEPFGVSAGGDHVARAEVLGYLDGHLTGVAGRAEDEHALPGSDGDPRAQRDPGGHRGVHRGGGRRDVTVGRQHDAATAVDDGALGHRSERGVRQDEVHEVTIGCATDTVDTGDQRQLVAAGVVRAVRGGAHARVQAGREHVDEKLVLAARLGRLDGLIAGRTIEGTDDGGVHRRALTGS
jgi:hypothetical protein